MNPDAMDTAGRQAEWDRHVTTALGVARTDKADLAAWDAEMERGEAA